MRKITRVEVESEVGAGTRGARMGVEALKTVGFNRNSQFFNLDNSVKVDVANEVMFDDDPSKYAIHKEGVLHTCRAVADSVSSVLKAGEFPFVLAGDHSSAAGTIAGIQKAFPDKRLGVIWVDAHADLQTPYTTESGNMHGMPLAMAIADDNEEAAVNKVKESTEKTWEKLKSMGPEGRALAPEDIVFIAARDIDKAEDKLINKFNIKNFTVEEVRDKSPKSVAEESLSILSECDIIYVSFDVDSLDTKISVGTGTPVPGGLEVEEAKVILEHFAAEPRLVAFEVVEINPTLDTRNKMAETAFDLIVPVRDIIANS